jgi:uncharacterized protein (DUF1800 family)/sugar lactone lactonase YvrE
LKRCARSAYLIAFVSLALLSANAQTPNGASASFGVVNVGTTAQVQTLTYTFSSATTLSAVNILTSGGAGLDYTDGGSSTCTPGTTYNANQSCTVTVTFTPSAPGLRSGGVLLFAQGNLPNLPLIAWYLTGVGQSSAVTIDPGTQSTIGTLGTAGQAYSSAIDGAGNVYVVDQANSQVIEFAAGAFTPSTVVPSGLLHPTALALDGAGNLYISDTGNSRVVMVPNEQGTLNSADMSPVPISGLVSPSPRGMAMDGSGNLYVTDSANGDVIEIPAGGGARITVVSGLASPYGLALDAALNVYVAGNNQVIEYLYPGYSTTVTIGGSYNNPTAVAVDASGAVYVADAGNARIVRVAGGASQSVLPVTGLISPQGVAVDPAGNLYVTDGGNVYEVNRTQAAALAFSSTYVGSTSTPQTLTVSDAGNQPLTISSLATSLATSANFTQVSGGTTCTSSTQLSSSAQCSIAVALAPTISGTLTGTLTLTDNALNNPASAQTVQLSGSGLQLLSQTINFPAVPAQTYGAAPIALNATASSGLTVNYAVTSGPATVVGNVLTITGAGPVTVQASQAGNTNYAAATPVSQTFTVNQATQTITFTQKAPAAEPYSGSFTVVAIASSGLPVSLGSSGPCTNVGATYTMAKSAGTCQVTGSQSGNANYVAAATVTETTTVSAKVAPTVTFTGAPTTAVYGSTFTVATTSNSGAAPTIAASGTCSITGTTVTMTSGTGPCSLTALWAATSSYLSASVIKTTTAEKAAAAVTFTGPASAPYLSTFTAVATSNSGIVATITAAGVCSISGTAVTMTSGTGSCGMTVKWATNNNYLAASATQTTTAAKVAPAINLTAPATAAYLSTFTVVATTNSGITSAITASGGCSISGATVTMTTSAGTCTTTAKWVTNNNYLAASATEITTSQKQASIITWPTPAAIAYPTALSATQLNATSNVAGKFVYLPAAGVVLPGGNQTLSVQFTPTNTNYASSTASTTLAVVQALAITSANSATTFAIGTLGSFTVTTTGYPAPALSESGSLPAGVTFTDNGNGTGTLQGTPTASGAFNTSITAQNGVSPNAVQSFTLTVGQVSAQVAARFLEQSSWGPTPATIAQVQQIGLQAYLQQQFNAPVSTYPTPATGAGLTSVQQQFFVNAMQGQDQLRQRVSFALSEIMVVSAVKVANPSAFSLWMNMLQNDAFGNFYNLLNDVTLSPTMGFYLDMGNNNGCKTCRPNENYAREVQQLFTIGLTQLNLDGTPQLDQNGNMIPTYTQSTVDGFAGVFTGWSYPPAPGKTAAFGGAAYYSGPMLPYNSNHVSGSMFLLDGTTLSAGGTIQADLASALQNIFNHPNVAPFISQQLIQKLVTSNPSPAYIGRVAQVFNNDGNGVVGDMQAVVTAILLDPEARRGDDPTQLQPSDGHLREPLLHMMTALRAVNTTTDGVNLSTYATNMLQPPFLAPDVFNFYPPNYQIPGTQVLGPEFNILNASTTFARINFINDLIYKTVGPHTTTNISPYVAAAGNVSNLLALVNTNIMHGQMPGDMYNTLFSTLSSSAFTNPTTTAQAVLYLTLSSSQFQVEH